MKRSIWLFLVWLSPVVVNAGVSISEVAWMGSSTSANYEWVELHNDGIAVDVTDWELSDGMNLKVLLTGVIQANTRVVLERTSDASAPGTAFLIYTGALVNSGATLRLQKADGSLVDQVSGGENWQNIGGDNVTKETAQYTTSGWVTAAATPGTSPDAVAETQSESAVDGESGSSKRVASGSKNKSEPVVLRVPDVTLALDIEAQTIGYVHQPITFFVEPTGIGDHLINSLSYRWNFGDGSVSTVKEPTHIFAYPGTYVVTVYAGYKRQEQVARHEITILPVNVSLTINPAGAVQINNDSPYEIDISGYHLRGEESFVFPPYSILLPNQTVTIAQNRIGDTRKWMVVLYDTERVALESLLPRALQPPTVVVETAKPNLIVQNNLAQTVTAPNTSFTFAASDVSVSSNYGLNEVIALTPTSTELLSDSITSTSVTDDRFTYLALVGVLSLGVLGIYASPRRNKTDSNLLV